jgi:hypothetical protein
VPETEDKEENDEDSEPVIEPLEPIGRPEVKVNETLVKEEYENTAFTEEESKPKFVPVPVPIR